MGGPNVDLVRKFGLPTEVKADSLLNIIRPQPRRSLCRPPMKPSRLQTLLLMLPTWAFAHAVLIFRVLPLDPKGTALIPTPKSESYGLLYFSLLVGVAVGLALLASTVAAVGRPSSAGGCPG